MRTGKPLLVTLALGSSLLATGFRPLHPPQSDHRAAEVPASDCGIDLDLIPDFALTDVNPASATYGETITRDSLLGEPLVMYWAQPS